MSEQPQDDPGQASIPAWTLGWRLRRALEYGDVSVDEMAAYLDYKRSSLSRWMHDKGKPPRPFVVKQWALRCTVDPEWLTDGVGREGLEPPAKGLLVRRLSLVSAVA